MFMLIDRWKQGCVIQSSKHIFYLASVSLMIWFPALPNPAQKSYLCKVLSAQGTFNLTSVLLSSMKSSVLETSSKFL